MLVLFMYMFIYFDVCFLEVDEEQLDFVVVFDVVQENEFDCVFVSQGFVVVVIYFLWV